MASKSLKTPTLRVNFLYLNKLAKHFLDAAVWSVTYEFPEGMLKNENKSWQWFEGGLVIHYPIIIPGSFSDLQVTSCGFKDSFKDLSSWQLPVGDCGESRPPRYNG